MLYYIAKRLAVAVVLLVVASFVIYALLHLAPGSPIAVLTGGRHLPQSAIAALTAQYHLNQPLLVQYYYWLGNVLHGNLGESISLQQSVGSLIVARFPITLELGVLATVFAVGTGVMGGTVAAMRHGRPTDTAISTTVVGLAAIPSYLSGILLIVVFAVSLQWFPVFGPGGGFGDRLYHLALPALALGLSLSALVARVTRSTMVRVLDDEYVEAARVRGLSEWRVVGKHALRNALGPVITVSGLAAGYLITGSVLVEVVFGLNGVGALLIQGVIGKDFAVVQGVALIFTAVFIVVNLIVDLLYFVVDPRTTVGRAR